MTPHWKGLTSLIIQMDIKKSKGFIASIRRIAYGPIITIIIMKKPLAIYQKTSNKDFGNIKTVQGSKKGKLPSRMD